MFYCIVSIGFLDTHDHRFTAFEFKLMLSLYSNKLPGLIIILSANIRKLYKPGSGSIPYFFDSGY